MDSFYRFVSCVFLCFFLLQTTEASSSDVADTKDKESQIPNIKDKLLEELGLKENQLPRNTVTPTTRRNGPITGEKMRRNNECKLDSTGRVNSSSCCFQAITIDFDEFGWDWIIAPKRIQSGVCLNECGRNNDDRRRKNYSCQPVMKDVILVYVNQKGTVLASLIRNMAATGCSCQKRLPNQFV